MLSTLLYLILLLQHLSTSIHAHTQTLQRCMMCTGKVSTVIASFSLSKQISPNSSTDNNTSTNYQFGIATTSIHQCPHQHPITCATNMHVCHTIFYKTDNTAQYTLAKGCVLPHEHSNEYLNTCTSRTFQHSSAVMISCMCNTSQLCNALGVEYLLLVASLYKK
jgi:hypothetical protein